MTHEPSIPVASVDDIARRCLAEARNDHVRALVLANKYARSGAKWLAVVHALYFIVEERKGATPNSSSAASSAPF